MAKIIRRSDVPKDTEYEPGLEIEFGVNESTVNSKKILMGYTVVPPGVRNQRHYHVNCEAAMFILKGRLKIFVGDEKKEYEVGPGCFIYTPNGEIHGLQNLSTTETAELIFSYGGVPSKSKAGTVFVEKPWV